MAQQKLQRDDHEHEYQQLNLEPWLNEDHAILDYTDVATAPCKDLYHVFVTENEIIFRWWKIVPPNRPDSQRGPKEIKNSYDDFLFDGNSVHSEIQRMAGENTLDYLKRFAKGTVDFLMRLPDEALKRIILFLDLEDMIRLGRTCKTFKRLCNDEDVWEKIFRRTVETPVTSELEALAEKEGWKRLFYTNKLQLQMQLRRQKREEHHGHHESQPEAMDAS